MLLGLKDQVVEMNKEDYVLIVAVAIIAILSAIILLYDDSTHSDEFRHTDYHENAFTTEGFHIIDQETGSTMDGMIVCYSTNKGIEGDIIVDYYKSSGNPFRQAISTPYGFAVYDIYINHERGNPPCGISTHYSDHESTNIGTTVTLSGNGCQEEAKGIVILHFTSDDNYSPDMETLRFLIEIDYKTYDVQLNCQASC